MSGCGIRDSGRSTAASAFCSGDSRRRPSGCSSFGYVQDRRARSVSRLLLLSLLPFGLATLFLVGHADLFVFARLVLVVGAPVFIGYAALVD